MIGLALESKRQELRASLGDAAEYFGVTRQTFASWQKGVTAPKPRFAGKVAQFLSLESLGIAKPEKEKAAISRRVRTSQRHERAADMAALYAQGQTLQEIGDAYGITRERVRQLLIEIGVTRLDGGSAVKASRNRAAQEAARDALWMARHGMTYAEFKAIPYRVKYAFYQQRRNAGTRQIQWNMSFAEWWAIWQQSGKWEQRGRGHGYVMARHGDEGPYEVGNVYICTGAQNASDSYQWKPAADRVAKRRQTMGLSA